MNFQFNNHNQPGGSFLLLSLFCFLFFSLSHSRLTAQSGSVLVDDGSVVHQSSFMDYTVPNNPAGVSTRYLYLKARGGDGGAFLRTLNKGDTGGGQGAAMMATFEIGNGADQIPPGSTIRFVIGAKGGQKPRKFGGSIGMGGGGGTGIVFQKPAGHTDQGWHILLVAGGGGGAYGDCCAVRSTGLPGSISVNGDNAKGLARGDDDTTVPGIMGGINGENTAKATCATCSIHYPGGGGIKMKSTSDPWPDNMAYQQDGGPVGGYYLKLSGEGSDTYGGSGFGGGGTGYVGGGGGGGYSGGGGRSSFSGGGGGGSFVSDTFAITGTVVKIKNGTTTTPQDGFAEYQVSRNAQASKVKNTDFSTPGVKLSAGKFYLQWQGDGNLVLYEKVDGSSTPRWATNTNGNGKACYFQGDGNLVIRNASGMAIWASNTANAETADGKGGSHMILTPMGNLFIVNEDGRKLWSAN